MTTRLDILTDALTIVARLIMAARSDRDAAALVHQLRAPPVGRVLAVVGGAL